ncbi:MAG: hypothetical protein A4S09_08005 [Proteobacteria bacterium SG_bin7]|nr:MAG: hypothetical protein A4S09_08005 [Proteobacteria bacterium SG_bin7]
MGIKKIKHSIFEVFFAIVTVNVLSFLTIFLVIHLGAERLEVVASKGQEVNKALTGLIKFESSIGDLNGPGNDIFESKNIDFEEARFQNYKRRFASEVSELHHTLRKSLDLEDWNRVSKTLDSIQLYGEIVATMTNDIFTNFRKKTFLRRQKAWPKWIGLMPKCAGPLLS